jgi:hypothetical protein
VKNNLAHQNPKLAKEWHPTKNTGKSPNDFTYGIGLKVWWISKKIKHNEGQLDLPLNEINKKII